MLLFIVFSPDPLLHYIIFYLNVVPRMLLLMMMLLLLWPVVARLLTNGELVVKLLAMSAAAHVYHRCGV